MRWDHVQSIKEVLKHIALKTHLHALVVADRKRRGLEVAYLNGKDTSDRFSSIYSSGAWINSPDQTSSSGAGSEAAATAGLVRELPKLLERLGCHTLLDVGCGDWNWMQDMALPSRYIGVDVVPSVIQSNRRFDRDGVSFQVLDAIKDDLPATDVAMCREMLFHLSFADGAAVLENVRRSARWLIATTDPDIWFNSDIRSGDFRRINLQRRPYRLPEPTFVLADGAVHPRRVLGAWPTEDLPARR